MVSRLLFFSSLRVHAMDVQTINQMLCCIFTLHQTRKLRQVHEKVRHPRSLCDAAIMCTRLTVKPIFLKGQPQSCYNNYPTLQFFLFFHQTLRLLGSWLGPGRARARPDPYITPLLFAGDIFFEHPTLAPRRCQQKAKE